MQYHPIENQKQQHKWFISMKVVTFVGKIALLPIVNCPAMHEAKLTQKSLSNQAAFCWTKWKIRLSNLLPTS